MLHSPFPHHVTAGFYLRNRTCLPDKIARCESNVSNSSSGNATDADGDDCRTLKRLLNGGMKFNAGQRSGIASVRLNDDIATHSKAGRDYTGSQCSNQTDSFTGMHVSLTLERSLT